MTSRWQWRQRLHPIHFTLLVASVAVTTLAANYERALPHLSTQDLLAFASSPDPTKALNTSDPNSHLSKILIPRPPDTANNTFVRNYIADTLRALNWHVEEDQFVDDTPYGKKTFTNVIATKDINAPSRVILSAHFDSKFFPSFPQNQFVGATDSAAPCAILLDVAEALNPLLDQRAERIEAGEEDEDTNEAAHTTLQLVFFDGEEAFKDWTDTDSVYGARHLAEKWATTYLPPRPGRRLYSGSTMLSDIEHLILLDLLGAAHPAIRSYFMPTAWLFDELISVESRLAAAEAFNAGDAGVWAQSQSFFVPRTALSDQFQGGIGDDHIPFLHRGVNILHVIASPFPSVWHTLKDDASALDLETMRRWSMIFRVFMAEYLGLHSESSPTVVGRSNGELVSPSIASTLVLLTCILFLRFS